MSNVFSVLYLRSTLEVMNMDPFCVGRVIIARGAHNWNAGTHARQTSEMRTVTFVTKHICVPTYLWSFSRRRFDHRTTESVSVCTDGAAVNVGLYSGIVPKLRQPAAEGDSPPSLESCAKTADHNVHALWSRSTPAPACIVSELKPTRDLSSL